MDTSKLKKFAQYARRSLQEQVGSRLNTVLEQESAARRETPKAVAELEEQIRLTSKDQVIEKVAYIWFNRFCALRFMDVNGYTPVRVVSPEGGQFQPAILAEAKMGHMDSKVVPDDTQQKVSALLSGTATSQNPQGEAYRLLLVAACNYYHRSMSYLFERIADYTELLIPDDLLSGNAILSYVQQAMTPDACKDVEIIGWLYQFYISEKKQNVFDGLKKNIKITPENIPAATQLFTPHWIVRYLVENSLGRLWMLNNPNSTLIEKMDYYIKPVETETDFLKIEKPEELKICDPACGSGHMLSYAYDLLYTIYEEEGTDPTKIPEKILAHNLYGIELDERAGELASFTLSMKAASGNPFEEKSNHRRFFRKPVEPNICILENVDLQASELKEYMDFAGRDLFSPELQTTLRQFDEVDNFGSLIRPACGDVAEVRAKLEAKSKEVPLLLGEVHKDILLALKQADFLSPKYHVVIANPPYMGSKGMNARLSNWTKHIYRECWDRGVSNLYAIFISRAQDLTSQNGYTSMVTMQGWMFTSSFETLRSKILKESNLSLLIHLGAGAFDSIGGQVVSTTAFVLSKNNCKNSGIFIRLLEGANEAAKTELLNSSISGKSTEFVFKANSNSFLKIPSTPIAYWATEQQLENFESFPSISSIARFKAGLSTGDNNKYQRQWGEVSYNKIAQNVIRSNDIGSKKWAPCNSGGQFRRWYGNNEVVVNWENNGASIKSFKGSAIRNELDYFKAGITYNKISSGKFASRLKSNGFIFDDTGRSIFCNEEYILAVQAFLASPVAHYYLEVLAPTLSFTSNELEKLPFCIFDFSSVSNNTKELHDISKKDWDSYELSWDFQTSPLLKPRNNNLKIESAYQNLCISSDLLLNKMKKLEEENNADFIQAHKLQNELTPDVKNGDLTIMCNPYYRYGNHKKKGELESLQLADAMREFISYAVGCMFGRYSLDKPGLILANQGDTLENYLKQVPQPSFMPDQENVIPILEDSWFTDDIVDRFCQFLKITFGEEHFEENLSFIEKAIGKDIRKFFVKDFYTDHLKRYKKRPIYWLFSSPKGTFNALIYLHRYRPDTASVVLNDYLREFSSKLGEEKKRQEQISISANASAGEKTKALKQIDKLNKMIDEIDEYERDVLFPLATEQVEIDLDDGVKHNYKLFGKALKKVAGLS